MVALARAEPTALDSTGASLTVENVSHAFDIDGAVLPAKFVVHTWSKYCTADSCTTPTPTTTSSRTS